MQALALIRNPQLIVASLAVVIALMLNSGRQALTASDVAAIQEAVALVDAGALVIDVRESPKTHLPGALLIPLEVLSARLSTMEVARTQTIVVYCGNGSRLGPRAAHALTQAGYRHVVNLQPGIEGWRKARLPVVAA